MKPVPGDPGVPASTRLASASAMLDWARRHAGKLFLLFVGLLVPLYLFGELAEDVLESEVLAFDQPLLLFMRDHASSLADGWMLFFSTIGSALVLLPLNGFVFIVCMLRRRRRDALFYILATAGAALLNFSAKLFFTRARPDLWPSIAPEVTYSFPSGHAMSSTAALTALIVLGWHTRWRYLMLPVGAALIFFIGLSRVYLGVHYPSDILAGWMASLAWVMGLALLIKGQWRDQRLVA